MVAKKPDTKVTRISASDSSKKKNTARKTVAKKPVATKAKRMPQVGARISKVGKPAKGFIGYFKGAWTELRQVHWPTRRSTWGLTGAVIAFSAFFVLLITLLDAGFKLLFELILK